MEKVRSRNLINNMNARSLSPPSMKKSILIEENGAQFTQFMKTKSSFEKPQTTMQNFRPKKNL